MEKYINPRLKETRDVFTEILREKTGDALLNWKEIKKKYKFNYKVDENAVEYVNDKFVGQFEATTHKFYKPIKRDMLVRESDFIEMLRELSIYNLDKDCQDKKSTHRISLEIGKRYFIDKNKTLLFNSLNGHVVEITDKINETYYLRFVKLDPKKSYLKQLTKTKERPHNTSLSNFNIGNTIGDKYPIVYSKISNEWNFYPEEISGDAMVETYKKQWFMDFYWFSRDSCHRDFAIALAIGDQRKGVNFKKLFGKNQP